MGMLFTFDVVGAGFHTQGNFGLVALRVATEIRRKTRGFSCDQHEQASRHGVEGTKVADTRRAGKFAPTINNVMAGAAGRFIDKDKTVVN